MGTFSLASNVGSSGNGNRPIYSNINGMYLYYWTPAGNWIIDHSHDDSRGTLYAHSNVLCPTQASGWKVWNGFAWSVAYSIIVAEVADKSSGSKKTAIETCNTPP